MGEATDSVRGAVDVARCIHGDLVRTVALGEEFVLSGSYDLSIKVCFLCPFPSACVMYSYVTL